MFRKFQWIGSSLLMAIVLITTVSVGNIRSVAQKRNGTKIVATFLPMYMFTKGVTGETGEVEILIPAGADPHEYQSTPENARTIAQADVLVKNGLGLEEFLEKLVDATGNSRLQEIDASQNIQPIEEEDEHHHGHDHDHDHEEGNPHVWVRPSFSTTTSQEYS